MNKVGLTGNYQSGYDEISKIFEKLDIPVFDCDLLVRFMVNFSPKIRKKIEKKFGNSYYKFGLLDMKLFQTGNNFENLFQILDLPIIKSYEKWRLNHYDKPYTIFKSCVLFEREFDSLMNYNIFTDRSILDRRMEAEMLTGLTKKEIVKIISNEMSSQEKIAKSDFVIKNNIPFCETENEDISTQIININKILKSKYLVTN